MSDSGSSDGEEIVLEPRPRPTHLKNYRHPGDVSHEPFVAKLREQDYAHNRQPEQAAKLSKAVQPLDPIAIPRKRNAENVKPEAAKLEDVKKDAAKWNLAPFEPVALESTKLETPPLDVLKLDSPKLDAPKLSTSTLKAVSLDNNPTAALSFPLSSADSHVSADSSMPASPLKAEPKPKPVVVRPGPPLPAKIAAFKTVLMNKFHVDEESINAENLGTPLTEEVGIHVFVDLSNILHGLEKHLEDRPWIIKNALSTTAADRRLPKTILDFDALSLLMERGRPAARRFVLGSWPVFRTNRTGPFNRQDRSDPFNRMVEKCKNRGYQTEIYMKVQQDPVPTKGRWKEQGVDEGLQAKIGESVFLGAKAPGTMVIATGDGARSTLGDGFCPYIEKALEDGWKVEIMAWGTSTSKKYLDVNWQYQWKEQLRFVNLEDLAVHLFELPVSTQSSAVKK